MTASRKLPDSRFIRAPIPSFKLNEYLSLGKPVVATPLPELADYNREFGDVLHLAHDARAFAAALRKALTDTTLAMRDRYRQVARQNSWAARVEDMSHLVEEMLKRRVAGKERST